MFSVHLSGVQEPFFAHISSRVTNGKVQLVSIVSLCLQDGLHKFHRDGEGPFTELSYGFRAKMSAKTGTFEVSWIPRRDRVEFSKCLDLHVHYYARVSVSNFKSYLAMVRRIRLP